MNFIAIKLGGKKVYIPKRPGEPQKSQANIKKYKNLKWYPKINIEDGIKIMIRNINDWKNAPIWTPKKIKVETKAWFDF